MFYLNIYQRLALAFALSAVIAVLVVSVGV
jgi:hypothetical protein